MENFIYKIMSFALKWKQKRHLMRMKKLKTSFQSGTTKHSFNSASELILRAETETKKIQLEKKVKEIVKQKFNNPEELLNFVKETGTDVFRLKYADIALRLIGEEEGFIAPTKGFKALYLNLFVNYAAYKTIVISFKCNAMFLLRPLDIDIYYMIHQFHKWYGFTLGLPGYDFKTQENFKKIFKTLKNDDISALSLNDIISLKEAISRDTEAIDFVVNLAKEKDTSKKLLNKLKDGKSVNL